MAHQSLARVLVLIANVHGWPAELLPEQGMGPLDPQDGMQDAKNDPNSTPPGTYS